MERQTKKASYLASKSKTELIEDLKVLFAMLCVWVFLSSFVIGVLFFR
jgi:hypothetical protein